MTGEEISYEEVAYMREDAAVGGGTGIEKALTGIEGFDEITGGGLPRVARC